MKLIIFISSLFFSGLMYSQNELPFSCNPLKLKDESVVLTAGASGLVFIHNKSTEDLWVTHPVSEPNASAGWSSRIQSGNWSALMVVNQTNFELSCVESKPGHEQQVPCSDVLSVCQWKSIKMSTPASATFWVSEDKSLDSLITYLNENGIELPASH